MKNLLIIGFLLFSFQILLGQNSRISFPTETPDEFPQQPTATDVLFEMTKDVAPPSTDESVEESKPETDFYEYWSAEFKLRAEKEGEALKEQYKLQLGSISDSISQARSSTQFEQFSYEFERLERELKKRLKFVKKKADKAKEFEFKRRNQKRLNFFPVRNVTDAQLFYLNEVRESKAQFLRNSLLSFGTSGNKVSIFNEIYADYFGPFRVGFGALVSNSGKNQIKDADGIVIGIDSTSARQDATQRLLGGGGNGVISLGYPLLNYQNREESFFFKTDFYPKFSMDVPVLGTVNEEFAWNMDMGIEGSAFYTGVLNNLTFFGNFRLGYTFGNDIFYSNLLKEEEKAFFFNQVTIGIAMNSTFRLGWNFYWGDEFVAEHFKSSISFSIIPSN